MDAQRDSAAANKGIAYYRTGSTYFCDQDKFFATVWRFCSQAKLPLIIAEDLSCQGNDFPDSYIVVLSR